MLISPTFRKQMEGYGLTTAEIIYHMPDHPSLLQTFIWQEHDIFPKFPELGKFLNFWQDKLDGAIHSVRVCHNRLIKPHEFKVIDRIIKL